MMHKEDHNAISQPRCGVFWASKKNRNRSYWFFPKTSIGDVSLCLTDDSDEQHDCSADECSFVDEFRVFQISINTIKEGGDFTSIRFAAVDRAFRCEMLQLPMAGDRSELLTRSRRYVPTETVTMTNGLRYTKSTRISVVSLRLRICYSAAAEKEERCSRENAKFCSMFAFTYCLFQLVINIMKMKKITTKGNKSNPSPKRENLEVN